GFGGDLLLFEFDQLDLGFELASMGTSCRQFVSARTLAPSLPGAACASGTTTCNPSLYAAVCAGPDRKFEHLRTLHSCPFAEGDALHASLVE
ncbi:MAG TPA: hypothetical protein VIL21_06140, partial [Solirubrobacterales bacterium]